MVYGKKSHDAHNIFESIALVNYDMENESGMDFPLSFASDVTIKDKWTPRIEWSLTHGKSEAHLGEYLGDDVAFMKAFLAAHRSLFEGVLRKSGYKKPQIDQEYLRWLNRAMRGVAGPSEDDLLKAQEVGKAPLDEIRRFEFIQGGHRKFWTIQRSSGSRVRTFTVCFGRIPEQMPSGPSPFQVEKKRGQVMVKRFSSAAECRRAYDRLVAEKLKKGYVEAFSVSVSSKPPSHEIVRDGPDRWGMTTYSSERGTIKDILKAYPHIDVYEARSLSPAIIVTDWE